MDELARYAWRVVKSVIYKAHRTLKRRQRHELAAATAASDHVPDPEHLIARGEEAAGRIALLGRLPNDLRAAVVSGELDDLTTSDAAVRQGVSLGTYKSRRRLARKLLRAWLLFSERARRPYLVADDANMYVLRLKALGFTGAATLK